MVTRALFLLQTLRQALCLSDAIAAIAAISLLIAQTRGLAAAISFSL
jgi:hypothetical protein